jgi:hypothetical protein
MIQEKRMYRIYHFAGEVQVSPNRWQRDPAGVCLLKDTLCVCCLVLQTCFLDEVYKTAQVENM